MPKTCNHINDGCVCKLLQGHLGPCEGDARALALGGKRQRISRNITSDDTLAWHERDDAEEMGCTQEDWLRLPRDSIPAKSYTADTPISNVINDCNECFIDASVLEDLKEIKAIKAFGDIFTLTLKDVKALSLIHI